MSRRYGLAGVVAAGLLLQTLFQVAPALAREGVQENQTAGAQSSLVVFEYPVDPQSIVKSGYPIRLARLAGNA